MSVARGKRMKRHKRYTYFKTDKIICSLNHEKQLSVQYYIYTKRHSDISGFVNSRFPNSPSFHRVTKSGPVRKLSSLQQIYNFTILTCRLCKKSKERNQRFQVAGLVWS